jgi:anti-sigma28 factor (negative regulator of flagellin synthesis)
VDPQSRPESEPLGIKNPPGASSNRVNRTESSASDRSLVKSLTVSFSTPGVQGDRVQDIKKRIADGTYIIPYEVIARRIYHLIIGQD